ncbi:MAG: hypothetical protein HC824_18535 [Synechococcales cyanobacterium RM1_1_8]|nr:hypothetical protein [Synechococcales cyanobacterium RM1_1_8]
MTFLYYFSLSTCLGYFVAGQAMDLPYDSPTAIQSGLLLGLFGGVMGALRNRNTTLELALPETNRDRTAFTQRFEQALMEMGFELRESGKADGNAVPVGNAVPASNVADNGGVSVYQKARGGSVLAGQLYVEREQNERLRVVGRVHAIKQLQAKL